MSTLPPEAPVLYAADLSGCAAVRALTPDQVRQAFVDTLEQAGARIVEIVSHLYPGQGLTCVLILRESHAVLHVWPESGTVHVDIFSCSPSLRSRRAIDELARQFGAARSELRELPRADGRLSGVVGAASADFDLTRD